MKIGLNPAFLFANFGDKVYFQEVLEGASRAQKLGFPSLGLEVYCDEQYSFYTPENVRRMKEQFLNLNLESTAFLACAPRAKLASITPELRQEGLKDFEKIAVIVEQFELSHVIALVTSAPPEAVPAYLDTYPGAPPASLILPSKVKWQDVWELYTETVFKCLEMCSKRGIRLAIEPLPMSVVSNTDSYLRLAAEIDSRDLGIFIDTSHLFYQRESLPVVIEKVKDQLLGFCACDNDGIQDFHWAPGKGKIDWKEVINTLQKVGYHGYIDLEINVADDPSFTYTQAREYLERFIKDVIK